jgi:hypothetical protein
MIRWEFGTAETKSRVGELCWPLFMWLIISMVNLPYRFYTTTQSSWPYTHLCNVILVKKLLPCRHCAKIKLDTINIVI